MATHRYWINDAANYYSGIIDFCCARCPNLSFVINERAGPGQAAFDFIDHAELRIKEIRDQKSWPGGGTVLPGNTCQVHYVDINDSCMTLLKSVSSLYDWVHPNLPEDLAFYRADGQPFFAVIGHERVAFFDIDENELDALKNALPGLNLSATAPL